MVSCIPVTEIYPGGPSKVKPLPPRPRTSRAGPGPLLPVPSLPIVKGGRAERGCPESEDVSLSCPAARVVFHVVIVVWKVCSSPLLFYIYPLSRTWTIQKVASLFVISLYVVLCVFHMYLQTFSFFFSLFNK